MKPALLFFTLFMYVTATGQLAFEEITAPTDFSLDVIRKSPTGEYFVQGADFTDTLYTSHDGQTWTKSTLPISVTINQMQFFSDGTPVVSPERQPQMVRRNATWQTMQAIPNYDIDNSFVKDDTLFTFQQNIFFYSLDKGETFIEVFEYDEPVPSYDHSLCKFDHHFVLLGYDGIIYFLSVFDESGNRVLHQELNLSQPFTLNNTCGEVILYDDYYYYRINESLQLTHGELHEILPPNVQGYELKSANGYYYARRNDTLYLSPGCDINWEIAATHEAIKRHEYLWIGPQGDVYTYNFLSDHYIIGDLIQNTWEPQYIDINWPYLRAIDESDSYHRTVVSSNNIFSGHRDEPAWIELDSSGSFYTNIQYSPDGDLYVRTATNLLHSKDNGSHFSVIQVPGTLTEPAFFHFLYVLDNDVLLYYNYVNGTCFFTMDNGATWVEVNLPFLGYVPNVKRVQNKIVIAGGTVSPGVARIDMITHEVNSYIDQAYSNNPVADVAILDDGTIYFAIGTSQGSALLRFRSEGEYEIAGDVPLTADIYPMMSSGNNLYGFDFDEYYWFSGDSLYTFAFEGLPSVGTKQFFIAESEHLFVMINQKRIFRSLEPLSHTKLLTGRLFYDRQQDCQADTLEPVLANWVVTAVNDHYVRSKSTDTEGKFNFDLPDGTYTVSMRPPNHRWDVCTTSFPITVDSGHVSVAQDFQAIALSQCAYLEIDFSTALLRRCFENSYTIRVRNTGPGASDGTIVRIQLDPYFEFISATLPQVSAGNNTYIFDLGVLELNEVVTFSITFLLSCNADLGLEHCLKGTLHDDNLCGERSQYEECQENIGSYDPNDKRVFNEAGHETERVDKGEYIYYHIRFQNTGTDTAFTVRINDLLSPKLDYSTLEMLSASHPYSWLLNDGPALSILFENILLPDSNINEPASHGYIKFRIKPLPGFDYGTSIPNTAGIYFDFNDPVLTNTVTTSILPPVRTVDPADYIDFSLSPNPAHDFIHISVADEDRASVDACEVMDMMGRSWKLVKNVDAEIDVTALSPGVYCVILRNDSLVVGKKQFVRM